MHLPLSPLAKRDGGALYAVPCLQTGTSSGNHPDLIYVTHEKPASIGVDDIKGGD